MKIRDRFKKYFYDHAPNSILREHIYLEFTELEKDRIETVLLQLIDEGFLTSKQSPPNPRFPGLQRITYQITDESLGDYPIKTEIEAAGIKVPRIIDGDIARAEDINSLIYAVNRIIDSKTKQLEVEMERQNKKYWGALITIFALFVSLFSIINAGVKPILISDEIILSPASLAFQSLLNIAPLTVILMLFVWLLYRILK